MARSVHERQFARFIALREAIEGVWYTWRSPGLWLAVVLFVVWSMLLAVPMQRVVTDDGATADLHLGWVVSRDLDVVASIGLDRAAAPAQIVDLGVLIVGLALIYWTQPSSFHPVRVRAVGAALVGLVFAACGAVLWGGEALVLHLAEHGVRGVQLSPTSGVYGLGVPLALALPALAWPLALRPEGPSHIPPGQRALRLLPDGRIVEVIPDAAQPTWDPAAPYDPNA